MGLNLCIGHEPASRTKAPIPVAVLLTK